MTDVSAIIAGDLIRDLAETFFGSRRRLEEKIGFFHSQVRMAKDRAEEGLELASYLNGMLTEPGRFYREINIISKALEEAIPKDGYVGKPFEAYNSLMEISLELNRKPCMTEKEEMRCHCIPYNRIRHWCDLLNIEIGVVNEHKLSYATNILRELNPAVAEKHKILGTSAGMRGMEDKLAFKEIDYRSLSIPEIPPLPEISEKRFRSYLKPAFRGHV